MLITIDRIKKWGKKQDLSKLIDALETPDAELRKAICLSLGETKSADALLALRYLEQYDPDVFVQMTARRSIAFMIDNVSEMPHLTYKRSEAKPDLSYVPA
jgi:HEAT repeat protein